MEADARKGASGGTAGGGAGGVRHGEGEGPARARQLRGELQAPPRSSVPPGESQALCLVGGSEASAWSGAGGGQEAHFFLKVPRILGMNLPTLLSLVSSSAVLSPAPGPPASSFLQKTSNRL